MCYNLLRDKYALNNLSYNIYLIKIHRNFHVHSIVLIKEYLLLVKYTYLYLRCLPYRYQMITFMIQLYSFVGIQMLSTVLHSLSYQIFYLYSFLICRILS